MPAERVIFMGFFSALELKPQNFTKNNPNVKNKELLYEKCYEASHEQIFWFQNCKIWGLATETSFEQFEPKRLKNFKSWTLTAFLTNKDSFYQKD